MRRLAAGPGSPGQSPLTWFRERRRFDALDGLRAVSIALVLWHHVPRYPPGHFSHVLQENGRYGVSLFFIISGFLICTLLLREQRLNGSVSLGKFYGRRACRLLPLYYATLAVQAALVYLFHQYSPENRALFALKLPSYLFYFSNWLATSTAGPFFCAWSLAVEEQFYLVFGFLMAFAPRRWIIRGVFAAFLLKAAIYAAFGNVDVGSTALRVLFSYQEPVLLGVLSAFALDMPSVHAVARRCLTWRGAPALLAAALAAALALHPMSGQSFWDAQLLYLGMTLFVASLVLAPRTSVLDHPLLVQVGRVSYGIYLLHMFVLSSVKRLLGASSPVLCFSVTALVVVLIASASHRWFESPLIERGRRHFSPATPRTPIQAAPPRPTVPSA